MDAAVQDYFRRVEEHFIVRRGRPLLLSPADVSRVAEWHDAGIPVGTVIEGIDVYFDRLARRGRVPRRAVTLAFVEDDVHDAWAGTRARRMGRASGASAAGAAGGEGAGQPLATPQEHARLLALLAEVEERLARGGPAEIQVASAVRQAQAKLARKAELFDPDRVGHDEQKTEDHLRRLERSLTTAAREALEAATTSANAPTLRAMEDAVLADLAGKRERMSEATLQRVSGQLLERRLREHFGLPRLSLFYA